MKVQQRGRLEDDHGTDQPARAHEDRTQAGDHTIGGTQIRRPLSRPIEDQQLVLDDTDSATTERAPPGPASRTTAARRCGIRTARSRTARSYEPRGHQQLLKNLGIRHAPDRTPSGHFRHADPQNAAVGSAARPWDRPGDPRPRLGAVSACADSTRYLRRRRAADSDRLDRRSLLHARLMIAKIMAPHSARFARRCSRSMAGGGLIPGSAVVPASKRRATGTRLSRAARHKEATQRRCIFSKVTPMAKTALSSLIAPALEFHQLR
jgi:hypothetical protein